LHRHGFFPRQPDPGRLAGQAGSGGAAAAGAGQIAQVLRIIATRAGFMTNL
jgi:hypothetical protein